MRDLKRLGTVIAAAVLGICTATTWAGDTAAETFGATVWPAKPVLTTNNDPEICGLLIGVAERRHLSAESYIDFGAAVLEEFPKVEWARFADAKRGGSLMRADLSLDNDGTQQTVVYRDNAFNWKGNWHYAYVFPSVAAFEAARERVVAEWLDLPKGGQYPSAKNPHFGATQYFPSALDVDGESASTGNVWGEHSLVGIKGRYYLVFSQNAFDRLRPAQLPVYRLRASGRVERTCVLSNASQDSAHVKVADLPAVESVLNIMRQIGNPGPDQGTMHSATWHIASATAAEILMASRPWVFAAGEGQDMLVEKFLEDWGNEEPWNRREVALLKMMRSAAEVKYSEYLQRDFGLTARAADTGARRAIASAVAGWLRIPQGYEEDGAEYCFRARPFTRAVLTRDREAFDTLVESSEEPEWSRALFDALEWPYAVDRLLALGADPNFKNESGKTALMMAAHLDRIDTVRKLLKAGARVNETTRSSEVYGIAVTDRIRRTALMYAAENASPRVLAVLLEAGENPAAKDSRGNGIGLYLSSNPRFANEEWRGGIEALLKGIPQKLEPSFDCRKATTRIERMICGSEALSIFDREIAAAFQRFRTKEGPSALAEQRAWLAERKRACSKSMDESCLGDMMRTRMRYLHARIIE